MTLLARSLAPWRMPAACALALASLVLAGLLSHHLQLGGTLAPGGQAPAAAAGAPAGTSARATRGAGRETLASLPLGAQGVVSQAIGAGSRAYRVSGDAARGGALRAVTPAQHLSARFERSGAQVTAGGATLDIALAALGYGDVLKSITPVTPTAAGNRVLYAHGALSEWYVNGPLGLEQGFTLASAPARPAAGALTLALATSGNVQAALSGGDHSITLSHAGQPALRYSGLRATDARGRALHSWLELRAHRVLIRVDARGARFPVTIDPFVQQGGKLTAASGEESKAAGFGISVALSANGSTALVGAAFDDYETKREAGAAWVFTRSGSTWAQQGPKLVPKTGEGTEEEEFGTGVSLSGDGNTALIGAPGYAAKAGAAWVFTRSGATWTQQQKLQPKTGEETGEGEFGLTVGISTDGNTALVGAPHNKVEEGAAWVFTRSGGAWTQHGTKLVPKTGEEGANADFASSVALSGDGSTALIGAPSNETEVGAAWVFTDADPTWTQQGPRLTANDETGAGQFGWSAALSSNGSTALLGGPHDAGQLGGAWVFTRSGSAWAQQGSKLLPRGGEEIGEGLFGWAVALAGDGNTALAGAPFDDESVGAAWAFSRSGSTWSQEGSKLKASDEFGKAVFGEAVALSSDGATALVGGEDDNDKGNDAFGAAWVFVNPQTPLPGTGTTSGTTSTTTATPIFARATAAPVITGATQTHRSWREGTRLAKISRTSRPPLGTTFTLTLNEPANVSLAFTQRVGGRKVKHRCVAQTPKDRSKPACKRTLTRGVLAFAGKAGSNRVAFQGLISRSKRLAPGTYTLVATATNASRQRSSARTLTFTIVR